MNRNKWQDTWEMLNIQCLRYAQALLFAGVFDAIYTREILTALKEVMLCYSSANKNALSKDKKQSQ